MIVKIPADQRLMDIAIPDHLEVEFGMEPYVTAIGVASEIRDFLHCFLSGADEVYRIEGGSMVIADMFSGRRFVIAVVEVPKKGDVHT